MLGLRIYRNTQVDLWQGEADKFVVDHLGMNSSSSSDISDEYWDKLFKDGQASGGRHFGMVIYKHDDAAAVMARLKAFLDERPLAQRSVSVMSRMTFIASNEAIYDALQKALFATFQEQIQ
jgi:hypothetical protein